MNEKDQEQYTSTPVSTSPEENTNNHEYIFNFDNIELIEENLDELYYTYYKIKKRISEARRIIPAQVPNTGIPFLIL